MAHVPTVTLVVLLSSGVLLAACGGDTTAVSDVPAVLSLVSGNGQTGIVSQPLPNPLVVQAEDERGGPLAGVPVTWSVSSGGGGLSAPRTVTDQQGQAAVTLTLGRTAGQNGVSAAVANLTPVFFSATGIPGTASRLAFTAQPNGAIAGAPISATVAIVDADGNTVTSASGAVTVVLGSNPGGALLSGTTTANPVNGLVRFTGLTLDKSGVGYTLVASSVPLASATSAAFTVTPGIAAKLGFASQPSLVTAGTPFSVTVAVQDALGNVVESATNQVTVAIGANPAGGTLAGASPTDALGGLATFGNLMMDKAGTEYTLVASATSLAGAASSPFAVAPGAVSSIWIDPGAAVLSFPNGVGSVQLVATVLDAYENPIPSNVAWATSANTVAPVSDSGFVTAFGPGIATISASFGGYQGTARIGVYCGPPRCTIPIATLSQPGTVRVGQAISPPVQFTIGNVGSTWAGTVSLLIGDNPSRGTLTGNPDVRLTSSSNTATWSDLRIDKPGTYTLVAIVAGDGVTGPGFAFGKTSASFVVLP